MLVLNKQLLISVVRELYLPLDPYVSTPLIIIRSLSHTIANRLLKCLGKKYANHAVSIIISRTPHIMPTILYFQLTMITASTLTGGSVVLIVLGVIAGLVLCFFLLRHMVKDDNNNSYKQTQ